MRARRPVLIDHRWDDKIEEFWKLFNQKMADMKIYYGVVNNAMIFYVRDAVSYTQEHCHDYRIKQKVRYIWRWLSMLEYRLKSHSFGWFKPESVNESIRVSFKEGVTENTIYDYWVQSAGRGYQMLSGGAGVLKHKFELMLTEWGSKQPKSVAYLSTAQWMLEDQEIIWQHCVDVLHDTTGIKKECLGDYLGVFRLKELGRAIESLIGAVDPENANRCCTDEEKHSLELAWESIESVLADPGFVWDGCIEAAAGDEDLFRTKGFRKKMEKKIADSKARFVEEYDY